MEYKQVCEKGHRFSSEDGTQTFQTCPFDGTPIHIEADCEEWKKKCEEVFKKCKKEGVSRGKLIDRLPRMPWFGDAVNNKDLNDPEQVKAHETWTRKDDEELAGLFAENGIGSHKKWAEISSRIGRSLFAVERQLRIIYARREFELEEFYEKEV